MNYYDGGPAFPITEGNDDGSIYNHSRGISMRDYFAAKAMQGFCAGLQAGDNIDALPGLAYTMADAMLAERDK